jgi:hypothetical protein
VAAAEVAEVAIIQPALATVVIQELLVPRTVLTGKEKAVATALVEVVVAVDN